MHFEASSSFATCLGDTPDIECMQGQHVQAFVAPLVDKLRCIPTAITQSPAKFASDMLGVCEQLSQLLYTEGSALSANEQQQISTAVQQLYAAALSGMTGEWLRL